MFVICSQNSAALGRKDDTNIIAWLQEDEPDNARNRGARFGFGSPTSPEKIVERYRSMKTADPTRPVFLNLGQGVAWDNWHGRGNRNGHPEDYPKYLQGCDIASFDIYPMNHFSKEVSGNLWFVARGVERLSNWTENKKPVWNAIECTRINDTGRKPTPREVRCEAWMSLIHGSRGLIYFVHQFKPEFREAALLDDKEMLDAVTVLNQQIIRLAPVINSPTIKNSLAVESGTPSVPVAAMMKNFSGTNYIFAVAMRNDSTHATFKLAGLTGSNRVEVLDEDRSLEMQDGAFRDTFQPWQVHLYRIHAAQ